jgi:hypothetical protein
MRVRFFAALVPFFLFFGCSPVAEPLNLPEETVDVVILGGSVTGLTVASALKGYDESLRVVLVEPRAYFVTEPYVNLYLVGMMDERLVFNRYDSAAKRRGYRLLTEQPVRVDAADRLVIFQARMLRYRYLVDARYCSQNDTDTLAGREGVEAIRELLQKNPKGQIGIDARALTKEGHVRARELETLIREMRQQRGGVRLREEAAAEALETVLPYALCGGEIVTDFHENFFAQYNRGLDVASGIIKEAFGKTFLPNMIKEESFVFTSARKLTGRDGESNTIMDGSPYLAKVKKIKQDIL